MSGLKDVYRDVQPVTLRLTEESVTSSLYCSTAEGMEARVSTLVEAFLVEVYRCRVCQFTSSLKARISTHVAERHDLAPSSCSRLPCLGREDGEGSDGGMGVDEEEEQDQNGSPYDLENDLHSGSKDSEDQLDHMGLERMSFLLPMYGMLQNISPRSCDLELGSNSDGSIHVAQTCEVSTLFEEDGHVEDSEQEAVFRLEDTSSGLPIRLSCGTEAEGQDEETAQSAHLMTLGLCRISSTKCPRRSRTPESRLALTPGVQEGLDKQHPRTVAETQKQVEEDGGLSCVLCQVDVSSRSLLEMHLKSHDGERGFKCPRCGWEAQEWADMERHWRGHGKRRGARPYKCSACPRTFKKANSRDAHEQRHNRRCRARSEPRPLAQCSLCPEWCCSERECELHQRCHFQGGFKCLHCDFTEKSWKKIQKHILNQHKHQEEGQGDADPDQQNAVSVSPKQEAFSGSIYPKCLRGVEPETWCQSRKKRVKHSTDGKRRRGEREGAREEHTEEEAAGRRRKLAGQKELCCTLCDRKFSSKLTMRRHMGIHQGDKPFKCHHCHYCTRLKASLVQHLRVHTGEKPYKCLQCSYASIDRSSLRRHSRTHTQEKPYRCQYCPYSSIQKKSLDLHSRRHHTGESFPCHLCQYATPDRQLLLRHQRKHHGPEPSAMLGQTSGSHCSAHTGPRQRPRLSK